MCKGSFQALYCTTLKCMMFLHAWNTHPKPKQLKWEISNKSEDDVIHYGVRFRSESKIYWKANWYAWKFCFLICVPCLSFFLSLQTTFDNDHFHPLSKLFRVIKCRCGSSRLFNEIKGILNRASHTLTRFRSSSCNVEKKLWNESRHVYTRHCFNTV